MIVNPYKKCAFLLIAFIASPLIAIIILINKLRSQSDKPKILIIPNLTRIGDLICTTPVLHAIKKHYPDAFIGLITTDKVKGVIEHHPLIDNLHVYRADNLLGLIQDVLKARYDISFNFIGTMYGSVLSFIGLIPYRYKSTRDNRSTTEVTTDWMNTKIIKYHHGDYVPRFFLNMLNVINIHESLEIKSVCANNTSEQKIQNFFECDDLKIIKKHRHIIGLSITAGNTIKEWGDDNYVTLINHILKDTNTQVCIIGTHSETKRIKKIILSVKKDSMDSHDSDRIIMANFFALQDLPSLISRFHMFISGDTGPMHIAHALNIPLIDIIGPVCIGELTPRGKNCIIVKPNPPVTPSVFAFKPTTDYVLAKLAIKNTRPQDVISAYEILKNRTKHTSVFRPK